MRRVTKKLVIPFDLLEFSRSVMLSDNAIVILGGLKSDFNASEKVYKLKLNWLGKYLSYTEMAWMKIAVFDFAVCFNERYIFVTGGKTDLQTIGRNFQIFDLELNQWTIKKHLRVSRYAHSSLYKANE